MPIAAKVFSAFTDNDIHFTLPLTKNNKYLLIKNYF